jgi:hypothetical protein
MLISTLKCFQLSYNPIELKIDYILTFLDTRQEVLNWYTLLPGQVFLISNRSAAQLAHLFRARFSNQFFTVSEIANIDGAMPKAVWDFLNDPRPSILRSPQVLTLPQTAPIPPITPTPKSTSLFELPPRSSAFDDLMKGKK